MNEPSKTPALDIVSAHKNETQAIHDFLEFMAEKGYYLTTNVVDPDTGRDWEKALHASGRDDFLYEFIGTNAKDVEKERQALLKSIQQ